MCASGRYRSAPLPETRRRIAAWKRRLGMLASGLAVLVICIALRYGLGWQQASAQSQRSPSQTPSAAPSQRPAPQPRQAPASARPADAQAARPAQAQPGGAGPQAGEPKKLAVVAMVNGEQVARNELAQECLRHRGIDVLESLVNKQLIAERLQELNVVVTREEVDVEIDRLARRFRLSREQWLQMLEQERQINPQQYAQDIIWPTLALRKLAADRLDVSEEELRQAYESQFGESVKARLIAAKSRDKIEQLRAQAVANPDDFGNLAKDHSEDFTSASAKGMVQPIRRHLGDPRVEEIAFGLAEDEISEIITVGDMYVILKCEGRLPARNVPLENVADSLAEQIRESKLRQAAEQIFDELQQRAQVENIYGDPVKRQQHPGLAAVINGRQISVRELAEEAIARHGPEILEGVISRKILEQALRKHNITVTQQDIDQEITRAAMSMGKVDDQGRPDVQAWIETITEEHGVPLDLYIHDSVWPTAALKKMTARRVEVTQDDLNKGYEANYGPRVRCRAIVLDNQRRAQEVWELARKNPSPEYFARLAEAYSIEASTRALGGEIPPIQKHGGQPALEKEAFALSPGELSGIVQVQDKFIILLCEGHTKPTVVEFEAVRDLLHQDIHEKKLRIEMAQEFDRLKDSAHIDNYLAGTSQSPRQSQQRDGLSAAPQRPPSPSTADRQGNTQVAPAGGIRR